MSVIIENPSVMLESLGINEFCIEYETKTITLPEHEFFKAVDEFERSPLCSSFTWAGWTWVKEK